MDALFLFSLLTPSTIQREEEEQELESFLPFFKHVTETTSVFNAKEPNIINLHVCFLWSFIFLFLTFLSSNVLLYISGVSRL